MKTNMKKCKKCEQIKDLSLFPIIKGKPYTYCKECKRILQRIWVKNKRKNLNIKK